MLLFSFAKQSVFIMKQVDYLRKEPTCADINFTFVLLLLYLMKWIKLENYRHSMYTKLISKLFASLPFNNIQLYFVVGNK